MKNIKRIVFLYLAGLIIFTLYRAMFVLKEIEEIKKIPWAELKTLLPKAFLFGLRYDVVVLSYILILPFLFFTFLCFIKNKNILMITEKIVFYITILFFFIAFSVTFADIPYFKNFYTHINASIFNWKDSPTFVFLMIIQEKSFFITLLITLLSWLYAFFIIKKIYKKIPLQCKRNYKTFLFSFIFFILMLLGARGRIEKKSPIRIGTAYFSKYQIINEIGLNPVFFFGVSVRYKIKYKIPEFNISKEEAKKIVESELDKKTNSKNTVLIDNKKGNTNIIIIIVESLSYNFLGDLTPNLNNFIAHGILFNNFFSSGTHTYNGIFSTITGLPSIPKVHLLKGSFMKRYSSLPLILKENGYQTAFFVPHDSQFDNMEGFLRLNGIDIVVSQKNYPQEKVLSTLGVPDDYMFEYSIKVLDKLSEKGKFGAIYLTSANHQPFVLPRYFSSKRSSMRGKMVEYEDWSIGKFVNLIKDKEWFKRTVLVILGDHGAVLSPKYPLPISLFHIPLIFYGKPLKKNGIIIENLGNQFDVLETIAGLLNLRDTKKNFGVNLFEHGRKYAFFVFNEKLGVIGKEFYYIKSQNKEYLYKYKSKSIKNIINIKKEKAKEMEKYALSFLKLTLNIINNQYR